MKNEIPARSALARRATRFAAASCEARGGAMKREMLPLSPALFGIPLLTNVRSRAIEPERSCAEFEGGTAR